MAIEVQIINEPLKMTFDNTWQILLVVITAILAGSTSLGIYVQCKISQTSIRTSSIAVILD